METVDTNVAGASALQDFTTPVLQQDAAGIYHPKSESDIQLLIAEARKSKVQLRVVGAAQSVPAGIYTDAYLQNPAESDINIMLDAFRSISYNDSLMQVTVGAGINLGFNPFDPTNTSTPDNGLYPQLQQKGWSIPNVTNAIHQTVAGFMSTGTAAGSMQHSFDECIMAVRLIDGTGNTLDLKRSDNTDDEFFAVGSSMGLLGVIVSVTLQCIPSFNIIGQEAVTKTVDCAFDFLCTGTGTKESFSSYLSGAEFSRTLWCPVKDLQRVIAWQARTMQPADYNPQTGTQQSFTPKPYQPIFPKVIDSTLPSEEVASVGFNLIARWPQVLYDLMGNNKEDTVIIDVIDKIAPYLYPLLVDMYFPCNTTQRPAQQFWDTWLGSLPMDKVEFGSKIFNLEYAEIWIPIDKTVEGMTVLQEFYSQGGYTATGFYTVEILGAKASSFWLSPSYGGDAMRLNIMRFMDSGVNNMAYYQQFWDLLYQKGIRFRVHWGKCIPPAGSSTGAAYMKTQYPKWEDFMTLRSSMDPDSIFVNSYWKTQLGIA